MLARISIILLVVCLNSATAQLWHTGDNATVKDCNANCDKDEGCWQKTIQFYEKTLMAQLRGYVSVQVSIDQWMRRHGDKKGQDYAAALVEAQNSMNGRLNPAGDVVDSSTISVVIKSLFDKISGYSDDKKSFIPHFQCPLPCGYRHDMYRNLFFASLFLNICLAVSLVPLIYKLGKQRPLPRKAALVAKD
ncbi:unnamed protein product, partial [Mesorhabditis spiculigera]